MIDPTIAEARTIAGAVVLLALLLLGLYWRRVVRVSRALGDGPVIRQLIGLDLERIPLVRVVTVGFAAAALGSAILAAADPDRRTPPRGPVVLLLDASGSMLVDDGTGAASRLEDLRGVATELVLNSGDTPVGIVAFAGRAFSLTPPTRDRAALEMYIDALDPTIVTQTGSALGAAVRQGIGLLAADGTRRGSLVLISDGDETDDLDAVRRAADLARDARIPIHTVGVGTRRGGLVPALDVTTGTTEGHLLGSDGRPIESRANPELLRSIAVRTGGRNLSAGEPDVIPTLSRAIHGDPSALETSAVPLPPFGWFALAALLLLAFEPLAIAGRR